jgi:hypothetical protein
MQGNRKLEREGEAPAERRLADRQECGSAGASPSRIMALRACLCFLASVFCLLSTAPGCAKQHPTLPPPPAAQPNPAPRVASDAATRVQTLDRLADSFARLSNQLPGGSEDEHRALMSQAFAQLQEILPMLDGPSPGAEFRQQMQVISDAQAELATGPKDLSPEPTIDTGLRAARDVLANIARSAFYERGDLTPRFDQLSAKLNELDTVRGPLHQVEVGEAVATLSQIITKMSHILGQRLSEQNSATQSASPPATQATGR